MDIYTNKSFEHRKTIVEARIQQLGQIFAVGIHQIRLVSASDHLS